MKKNFLSLGLIAAVAFTLTNCTQEIANPVEPSVDGMPFEIVASPAETKTTNNGMSTEWAEGDAINLFHAESETTTYVSDGEFKFSGENTFKGTLNGELTEGYCYDWYAIYPYSSYIKTPANTGSGYSYIGSRSDKSQKQIGNSSMSHIAGSNYPLVGVCKEWEYFEGEPVLFKMSHASSLLEVVVTNNTEEEFVVETVSFTAPENIVGTFYIDFTGDNLVFTDGSYVAQTANLEVANGTALAKNESAKFYIAVKPFTAAAGQKLTLSVNGYPKEVTLSNDMTFTAGKIKTLNFAYDNASAANETKVKFDFTSTAELQAMGLALPAASAGTNLPSAGVVKDGVKLVSAGGSTATRVWNSNGSYDLRTYKTATLTLTAPEGCLITKVALTGGATSSISMSELPNNKVVLTVADGASTQKISTITVTYLDEGGNEGEGGETTDPTPEVREVTIAEFNAAAVNPDVFYTLRGTITGVTNTSYGNFYLTDQTGTVYIYGLYSNDGLTEKYWATSGAKLGDDIVVTVARAEFNSAPQGKNARFVELITPGTIAFYTLSTGAIEFASTGGEQVVTVSAYNTNATVTATSDNPKFAVAVNAYNVTISSEANTLEQKVEGNVTIKVGDLEATTIKVTLAAKPAADVVEGGSDDFSSISSTSTSYVSGKTTAGWQYKNCAIFKGGSSDSSPAFKMIGDASNRALCMNGKTSAVGTITSPVINTGCGTLKFNYGLPFSDTKLKFRVDIKQNSTVVKTFTIDKASATKLMLYSHEETINVAGEFQIVFTNLSPSNANSNKDRTAIWDVEWSGYAE